MDWITLKLKVMDNFKVAMVIINKKLIPNKPKSKNTFKTK